jgi:hypothetical protein
MKTSTLKDNDSNKKWQFTEINNLIERVKGLNLPKVLSKKLYFTTYIDLANPIRVTLTEKVCKNLKGKNVRLGKRR